ncbi:MAG: type VI secretion system ATPase TssH [Rhodospirillales bacterium]|nr:type VI secretion system ATPase TssH [Rhodospirillales bacterium]
MPELKALIGRLNPHCRRSLEKAAERCLRETHFTVELEHLLLELIAIPDTDVVRALATYDVDRDALVVDLEQALDRCKRGNVRTPALSPHVSTALAEAWSIASLDMSETQVRSGALLCALLDGEALRGLLLNAVPLLSRIPRHRLIEDLPELMRGSIEDTERAASDRDEQARSRPGSTGDLARRSATPALDAYTHDLTADARDGRIDPIVGRDAEIRQVIDILMRRRQNNPILTGDAGVGKTAIVEGFAQRIIAGQVPPSLAHVTVRTLDLGLLQAGAGVRGEFEHRLKLVIDEVSASTHPIVLFIDEAHTMIGAGGQAGQGDAANLLKPALARGSLRTIAATTWGEYKRYIEKDPALARRFQVIKVAEPPEDVAIEMLRGVSAALEAHHKVRILDEAIIDAVSLSHRYISGRQLPDKAIGVLDTAAARVAIAQADSPAPLQDARRRVAGLRTEIARLEREGRSGADHNERIEHLTIALDSADEAHNRLQARWQLERETVRRIRAIETRLEDSPADNDDALRRELAGHRLELEAIQEENALVPAAVDGRVVADVVSSWTGIPVGRMLADTLATARTLAERMQARIIGQHAALDTICRRIQTFYAELSEPNKPTGVFLLVGPSGVGKTETAMTLADLLFGGQRALITVNMSEYQEAHSVSGLRGAPPGYVGHGKGGVLTEAVRRRPYCVLLLDEVEKAHSDVLEVFYQVFDRGMLEDSDGQVVDFTNTVILLTSNVGWEILEDRARNRDGPAIDGAVAAIRPALLRCFPAALLARLVIVPYRPLDHGDLQSIARLKLARIQERFALTREAELTYDDAIVTSIVERARETESGARTIDAILTHSFLPSLSGVVLDRLADDMEIGAVHVRLDPVGEFAFEMR